MKYYADLHLHSYFSRATSKNLKLEYLYQWAQLKGIQVIGTGDCIHPQWLEELKQKLEPAEPGFYKLRSEYTGVVQDKVPKACKGPVRFMLTGEISNIYKRLGKVRKVHNVIFLPDFESADKVQAKLEAIGNIRSDGRPILGLDSRDLLEIVLESNPLSYLIPAHIWTPWFSALGSKGGFDRMEDCFGDLTKHIFAVETGLSSDPPMNWRLSQLDPYVLVSNSDAHSPEKLAREATIFDTEFSYLGMYHALSNVQDKGLAGTIEFFPEEGKYHYDGHRKCKTRLHPGETIRNKGLCPVCQNPVTVGVMARVEELADRAEGQKSKRWRPYHNLIPLPEIIADTKNVGPTSKKVQECFHKILHKLGSEIKVLLDASTEDIEAYAGSTVAEGIRRVRANKVEISAGYDGEYGTIRLFSDKEKEEFSGSTFGFFKDFELSSPKGNGNAHPSLNSLPLNVHPNDSTPQVPKRVSLNEQSVSSPSLPPDINPAQWQAITHKNSHVLIVAGPGTGKTHTLTHRIAKIAAELDPQHILAITFTNKAADEMQERLRKKLGQTANAICCNTFHRFCLQLLRLDLCAPHLPANFSIATPEDRDRVAKIVWPDQTARQRTNLLNQVSSMKNTEVRALAKEPVKSYTQELRKECLLDFDDLLLEALGILGGHPEIRRTVQRQYRQIFVDEYQDINPVQHALLKELVQGGAVITAIGDPNQAIYGFRGAEPRFFLQFNEDFPGATQINLHENYRSAESILNASSQVIQKGHCAEVQTVTAKLVLCTP